MRLPAGGEPFPMRRIASFMGAVVVYTALLNLALNSDLLLLRKFALSAPGVDATPRRRRRQLRGAADVRASSRTRRCWW